MKKRPNPSLEGTATGNAPLSRCDLVEQQGFPTRADARLSILELTEEIDKSQRARYTLDY